MIKGLRITWRRVAQQASRIVISAVLLVALLALVRSVGHFNLSLLMGPETPPQTYVPQTGKPMRVAGTPSERPFWPRFPRTIDTPVTRGSVFNGVHILTESWQSSASPAEIMAFYRLQMPSRGWSDVTEETFHLAPEGHGDGAAGRAAQSENYLRAYRDIMDSNLVLTKGSWNVHFTVGRGSDRKALTAVKILAAEVSSFQELTDRMASATALGSKGSRSSGGLDMVEEQPSEHYHTRVRTVRTSPVEAFQSQLAALKAEGWATVVEVPAKPSTSRYFAWISKGRQYAALSVSSLEGGRAASVTLTEVSPHE